MDVNLFDFGLPEELIALRPVVPRDRARQLIIRPDSVDRFLDSTVDKLVDELRAGDVLVFNDTRVIPSRLFGMIGTAKVEVTLHRRTGTYSWWCFMKNGRRANIGKEVHFTADMSAYVTEKLPDGQIHLEFKLPVGEGMETALARAGQMPLPPYIASKRAIDAQDMTDYQTLYAQHDGAVAAPTAGLHFTPNLLDKLKEKGVHQTYVTLHVGAGTFLPMKVDNTDDHQMHAEWGEITPETAAELNDIRAKGGRIVAVGTTSLRLLESSVDKTGIIQPFSRETAIFITPGYTFRAVNMLMTNFHLPKSTLFMLVSAFAGMECMRDSYTYAIAQKYRFYSYGDSSLIYRAA
jgi:S-adenosylmethionine:tRNA ribosyltransferase-isomerase